MAKAEEKAVEKKVELAPSVDETLKSLTEEVNRLKKEIDVNTPVAAFTDREDLEPVIANIVDLRTPLLKALPRKVANGRTHEVDVITSTGTPTATATATCGAPQQNEPLMERRSVQIKQFAHAAKVCNFAQAASEDFVSLRDLARENAINVVMLDVERLLFFGDSSVNALEFDGLLASAVNDGGVVTDVAGGPFALTDLNNVIQAIFERGGVPTDIWMSAKDLEAFVNSLSIDQTVTLDPGTGSVTAGVAVSKYRSPWGILNINYEPTLDSGGNTDIFVTSTKWLSIVELGGGVHAEPIAGDGTLSVTEAVVWRMALQIVAPEFQGVLRNVGA